MSALQFPHIATLATTALRRARAPSLTNTSYKLERPLTENTPLTLSYLELRGRTRIATFTFAIEIFNRTEDYNTESESIGG